MTATEQLGNVLVMQQRGSKMQDVKVWPTVPVEVRKAAESVAGTNLKKGAADSPKRAMSVLRGWLIDVVALRSARSPAERLAIAERLAGKPLVLPAGEASS